MGGEQAYRALTDEEIAHLEANGTRAEDWSRIRVAKGFSPSTVVRSVLSGEVRLGVFRKPVERNGVPLASGVYDAHLHDATVADDALVQSVGLVARVDVGPGACLFHCGTVCVEGESAFGNGVEIEALNEGGGRAIRIFERLSAPMAYLGAAYRHRPRLVQALDRMAEAFAASRRATRGGIGAGACVANCARVRNVAIGPAARVEGALELENGSILSKPEAPAIVGAGVAARDFIVSTGSVVDGGAILSRVFVGQGCRIGRQFSAEGSAFFANSEGFHGEAVSVLGGPYTVSHHKGTLLIAGLLSFFNAGSGTNQSNHMYKLGPLHQGILERGSKTGSFSYLLWPARVGAFTAVTGKHYANFDARNLPFSYITEEPEGSVLSPAVNLFTVGTRRDGEKWPRRDRRTDPDRLDPVHFAVFSPFTVGRMMQGRQELAALYEAAPREQKYVAYKGVLIKRLLCRAARKHYGMAVRAYLGGLLAERLERAGKERARGLKPSGTSGQGAWADLLGLLAPQREVELLCDAVEEGSVRDPAALEARFRLLHDSYAEWEWNWAAEAWKAWAGKAPGEMSAAELARAVEDWKDASIKLNRMIRGDAEKEFGETARIGFGLDGDEAVRDRDFEAVRGTAEGNAFVQALQAEAERLARRAEALLEKLRQG
ncbi:MAG: DUF4954 family protein [Planctomycetota bacterium]